MAMRHMDGPQLQIYMQNRYRLDGRTINVIALCVGV